MGEKIDRILQRGAQSAIDIGENIADRYRKEGAEEQWLHDCEQAVWAFVELGTDDAMIYHMLGKYFGFTDSHEQESLVWHVRVQKKIQELNGFLTQKGLTTSEQIEYRGKYSLRRQLERHPEWVKLSPEKLDEKLRKSK